VWRRPAHQLRFPSPMTSAFHCVRTAARAASSARAFSTSAAAAARRNVIHGTRADRPVAEDLLPDDAEDPEDTTWAGHMSLQQQRDELYYQRLIEHEIPKLARASLSAACGACM
jgi:hypothetical protein